LLLPCEYHTNSHTGLTALCLKNLHLKFVETQDPARSQRSVSLKEWVQFADFELPGLLLQWATMRRIINSLTGVDVDDARKAFAPAARRLLWDRFLQSRDPIAIPASEVGPPLSFLRVFRLSSPLPSRQLRFVSCALTPSSFASCLYDPLLPLLVSSG
jgi:hypothetical protein